MPTDNQIPAVSTRTLFQRCFKSALPALKQNLPFCTLLLSSALPVAPVYAQTSDEWDELDEEDRKSTRLNSSHYSRSRMPSSA